MDGKKNTHTQRRTFIMSENNNTNTSGYEIRQGLLQQAQRIVEQNAHMQFETSGKQNWSPVTSEQVIKVAEELNTFVQKKD